MFNITTILTSGEVIQAHSESMLGVQFMIAGFLQLPNVEASYFRPKGCPCFYDVVRYAENGTTWGFLYNPGCIVHGEASVQEASEDDESSYGLDSNGNLVLFDRYDPNSCRNCGQCVECYDANIMAHGQPEPTFTAYEPPFPFDHDLDLVEEIPF